MSLVGFVIEEKGCRVLADLQAFTWGLHKVVLSGLHAAVLWIKQCILHQGESLVFMQPYPGFQRDLSNALVSTVFFTNRPKYISIT